MTAEMAPKNIEVVVEVLSAIIESTPISERPNKVYFEGPAIYSFPELLDEVKGETTFGKRYAQTLVDGAAADNKSLAEYFGLKPQE